jgi:hypothetical protein
MTENVAKQRKEQRFALLKSLYEATGGNLSASVEKEGFLRKLGWPAKEAADALAFLDGLKLIKSMRFFISLSSEGVTEVKSGGDVLLAEGPKGQEGDSAAQAAGAAEAEDEEFMTVTVAEIYIREGKLDKAAGVLEKILALNPGDVAAKQALAKVRQDKDRLAVAEESRLYHIVCSPNLQIEEGADRKVYNACLGMDIIGFTKKTDYQLQQLWIKQFYGILERLFEEFSAKDSEHGNAAYLLIMVGDGAYICFLNPESIFIHFKYLERFIQELAEVNQRENSQKEGGREWSVRSSLTFGQDYLTRHDFGVRKFINVYGPAITNSARILAVRDDIKLANGEAMLPGDIRVDGAVHASIEGDQYFKANYRQIKGREMVKDKEYDFVVYRK